MIKEILDVDQTEKGKTLLFLYARSFMLFNQQ